MLAKAQEADDRELCDELALFTAEQAEWKRLNELAPRILSGEHKAYTEALVEFSPLAELSNLGSSIHFTVHRSNLIECVLKVVGPKIIPQDVKSLTTSGKVSTKPMPKARRHEIYQDYVCGCVLRTARELFAMLPIETALVTASVDTIESSTGGNVELPVLSVAIPRADLQRLNFDTLDPSDAIETFLHRGDFKASRKSGEFLSVTPLTPRDLSQLNSEGVDVHEVLAELRGIAKELKQKQFL